MERIAFSTAADPQADKQPSQNEMQAKAKRHNQHQPLQSETSSQGQVQHHEHAAAAQRSAGVLVLALAIHSFFETMALGLSDTPLTTVLLAASVGLHQVR